VSGHQRLAGRRQVLQKTDPSAGRFLGVVFEAVVPVGVVEPDREHGIAGERQPVAAGTLEHRTKNVRHPRPLPTGERSGVALAAPQRSSAHRTSP
jgi:hypothetical protein